MFRNICVILREFVFSILSRYTNMSNAVVGNTILYNKPKNSQLIDKLSHSFYMFRHSCAINYINIVYINNNIWLNTS
jgi:hypothetical protein